MARQRFQHKSNYQSRQPGITKALYPGMIAQFKYSGDRIFDKTPLIMVVYNEYGRDLVHGINLNYLPESQVQKLFRTCELLHKGASVYSNEKITRKHLDNLALRINIVTNSSSNKKIIGSYYIAYGSLYENEREQCISASGI